MFKSRRAWFEVRSRPEKKSRWRRKGGGGGPRAVLLGCTQCTVVMMGSDKTRITRLYPACLYSLKTSWLTADTTCRLFCSALVCLVVCIQSQYRALLWFRGSELRRGLGHLNSGETATSNWMCGLLAPSIHFCTVQQSQTKLGRSKKNTVDVARRGTAEQKTASSNQMSWLSLL